MCRTRHSRSVAGITVLAALGGLGACASFPQPNQVRVPAPIGSNSGAYLSPYTSDGTISPWVRNARAASAGASIGGFVGRKGGEKALESVPLLGGFLGKRVGQAAGRAAALALVGGTTAMKAGSDLSFRTADDLAVFLYAYVPADSAELRQKGRVISLTQQIYPEVQSHWVKAIKKARLAKGEEQIGHRTAAEPRP